MEITNDDLILVTGATGLVGSHVCESAREKGHTVRALVRSPEKAGFLKDVGVELAQGDVTDSASLAEAAKNATIVIHCAAKVGDWGPVDGYRKVNVEGLESLLAAVKEHGDLKRFVHVSSLGVYAARDHHGTDESEPMNDKGIDGYTLTKVESERVVQKAIEDDGFPAVILRPGFIYGPRDQTVIPRVIERLRDGKFKFLGSGEKLVNNTYVSNLVEAIWLALANDKVVGEIFNIRDDRLVSKKEFFTTIAQLSGIPEPTKSVPLGVAKVLAKIMEGTAKLFRKKEAPLLSKARIKFLGLNLDFSIAKAKEILGYTPSTSFGDGMKRTIESYQSDS